MGRLLAALFERDRSLGIESNEIETCFILTVNGPKAHLALHRATRTSLGAAPTALHREVKRVSPLRRRT
jgi:hypothetical protein